MTFDWDGWYQGGKAHYTIYWAATGNKPALSLLLAASLRANRDKLMANILRANPLFARLKAKGK